MTAAVNRHAGAPGGQRRPQPPPVALTPVTVPPVKAAAILGVSRDWFDKHVLPEVRHIRRGRMRLIPVRELERWAEKNAALWGRRS